MAIIKCPMCNKEISNRASACIYCGSPIRTDEMQVVRTITDIEAIPYRQRSYKSKQKFYQRTWFTLLMLLICYPVGIVLIWNNKKFNTPVRVILSIVMCLHFMFWSTMLVGLLLPCDHIWADATDYEPKTCMICGKIEGEALSAKENGGNAVIDEIEIVETLFPMSRQEILSQYSNIRLKDEEDEDGDLLFNGMFAGNNGEYTICMHDKEVWRIIFERFEEEIDADEVVGSIESALGEYAEYDSEWNAYGWETDNLQIEFYVDERTYFDWIGEEYEHNTDSDTNGSSTNYDYIEHYCDAGGCYKEGTRTYTGISGATEYYCSSHYNEMMDMMNDMGFTDSSNDYDVGYGYDSSDPYYSANDHNNDGLLTDEEWQDAMSDALEDYWYLFE